jgi:ribosomal protein S18 acetylase RimI-like enzyme
MMVRREHDKSAIARVLGADPQWALYALADLDDTLFPQCEWWTCGGGLALVFHGLDIRPIFVMGEAAELRALLAAVSVPSGYLNLRERDEQAAQGLFTFRQRHEMYRMVLDRFVPTPGTATGVALTRAHLDEILALYASDVGGGVAFAPAQLDSGVFRGIREDGALIAVAGVQVLSVERSVAAVGNVFVRRERRGQGLAQAALSATVAAVLAAGVRTVGLNVERSNTAAIRAYEKLGFRPVLSYVEGPAVRVA